MQRMMITICVFIRMPLKKGKFQTNFKSLALGMSYKFSRLTCKLQGVHELTSIQKVSKFEYQSIKNCKSSGGSVI